MANIDINQLTDAVNEILIDYGNEIAEGARISAEAVGKETVKQLKATSPKNRRGSKRKYARTWKMIAETNRLGSYTVTIVNEKNWRLTHLLENGHHTRNGKFVSGTPHIAPAEEQAIAEFEKRIRAMI